jgi:hypothetical protein
VDTLLHLVFRKTFAVKYVTYRESQQSEEKTTVQ